MKGKLNVDSQFKMILLAVVLLAKLIDSFHKNQAKVTAVLVQVTH